MKVLVACEESQTVCKAFRAKGHEAYSCDILPCSGGHPEWHLQMDAFKAIDLDAWGKGWDLIILHPPCTCIAVSGNRWYGSSAEHYMRVRRHEALEWTQSLFTEAMLKVKIGVALENPVGVLVLKDIDGKAVQPHYVQPWQFGHGETKKTGFWLFNLPKLKATNIVEGREQRIWRLSPDKKGKEGERARLRSQTFFGIAAAMAEQWG